MPVVPQVGLAVAVAVTLGVTAFCSDQDDLARAYDLQRHGSLKQARVIYESAISHLRSSGDSATLAGALRRLSEVDLAEGKYADAEQHAFDCAGLSHKANAAAIEVDCLSVAGRAQVFSGDYPGGLATHQRALGAAKARGSAEDEIALLNNIGAIHFFLGQYEDAYRSYLDAQSLLNRHQHEAWYRRRQQLTLANLAAVYQQLGQYQRALDSYSQIRSLAGAMRPSEQALLLTNMGTLYRRLGDSVKAIETYRQAQQLFRMDRNLDGEIGVIRNTGIALALDMGDLKKALAQFHIALEMAERSGNRLQSVQAHLYLGETFWRLGQLEDARQQFEFALSGSTALKSSEDHWMALYGLGRIFKKAGERKLALQYYQRAIAAVEGMRYQLRAVSSRASFLADKRDVYDSMIGALLDDPNPEPGRLLGLIEGAKARTFQDRVKKDPRNMAETANVTGRVVVDFWMGREKCAAVWMSTGGSGITRLQAPAIAQLESYAKELANGTGDGWRAASLKIGNQLLAPLASQINKANQLVIVPDGALQRIPFETLTLSTSARSELLVEKFAVSYVPSISAIKSERSSAARTWSPPWRRELIAFADPRVDPAPADSLGQTRLANLPASREEVRLIAGILGGRSEIHSGTDDRKRYVNAGRLRGVPLLHMSTHAVADSYDADRSRIVFSPEENGQSADFLFAREISNLNLNGVRLATLAACDTEGGEWTVGEGVQSFSRAFLEAGAASVVTTLWRIGDQSSLQFMQQFYMQLANGKPAAEALRQAKLAFYHSNSAASHPKYWAVFVLNGDPRTTAPKAIPWIAVLAPIAIALAIVTLCVRRALSRPPKGL